MDPDESTLEAAVTALNSSSIFDEDGCVTLRDVPSAKARIEMIKETLGNNTIDAPVCATDSDSYEDNSGDNDDIRDPDYVPSKHAVKLKCERGKCNEEIFAACQSCMRAFCYDHFKESCPFCSKEMEDEVTHSTGSDQARIYGGGGGGAPGGLFPVDLSVQTANT